MGPPSSGATTVAQTLKLIEPFKPVRATSRGLPAPFMHLVAEAQRLAFADRARYIADPAFQHVPVNDLLNDSYLDRRRRLIAPDRAMRRPPPPGAFGKGWRQRNGKDRTVEGKGTSHMSILDRYGNGVSMTTTIEGAFGSRLMAAGFLLNNELTDFSLPYQDRRGHKIANRVEGGKRPRSSMAPTMIFDRNGRLVALLGSPGGEKIILYVTKLIVALIDYGMSPERAAQLANFGSTRTGGFRIEPHGAAPPVVRELQRRGHRLNIRRMISGSHLITHFGGRLRAGVDPRREGAAAGQGFRR